MSRKLVSFTVKFIAMDGHNAGRTGTTCILATSPEDAEARVKAMWRGAIICGTRRTYAPRKRAA